MEWKDLTSEEQLKKIVKDSEEKKILIFKYSTRCSISARIYDRLNNEWNEEELENKEKFERYYLDLIKFRKVSNQIAKDFDVYHESPQVLIIHKGKSIYDDSHSYITFEEIKNIVNEN